MEKLKQKNETNTPLIKGAQKRANKQKSVKELIAEEERKQKKLQKK